MPSEQQITSQKGNAMNKKEITSILSRAGALEVRELSAPIKEKYTVEIIKGPQKSLAMVQVREPVKRSLFYLGEVLVTECVVRVDGVRGQNVMAGDDFEKVMNCAVIDGALNKPVEEAKSLLKSIAALGEQQKKERSAVNAQIMKSKVNFNVMGE